MALTDGSYEYVHIDVSDQFSRFGKWSVAIIYILSLILVRFPPMALSRPVVSLACTVFMILWRVGLVQVGSHGPTFSVGRSVVVEVLIMLFGNLLIAHCLHQRKLSMKEFLSQHNLAAGGIFSRCIIIMMISAGISAVLGDYSALLLLHDALKDSPSSRLALFSGMTIGAVLSMTGNLSNVFIAVVMYDEITFFEFLRDKCLPAAAAFLVYVCAIRIFAKEDTPSVQASSYEGVSTEDENDNGKEVNGEPCTIENDSSWEEMDPEVLNEAGREVTSKSVVPPKQAGDAQETDDDQYLRNLNHGFVLVGIILFLLLSMIFCHAAGINEPLVSLGAAVILVILHDCRRRAESSETSSPEEGGGSPMSKFDYGFAITLVGQMIMTGSVVDTGLPQYLFNATMGKCADQMTNGSCTYQFAAVISLVSIAFSPINASFMLTATFPYASPYDWMQVTLVLALAGPLSWNTLGRKPGMVDYWFAVPTALLSMIAGVFLLSVFHWTYECSVKLGDCGFWP